VQLVLKNAAAVAFTAFDYIKSKHF